MVVAVLTTKDHDLTFDVMDQSITENLMFIWHIYAHWAIFLHIPAAVCALVFKQFLSPSKSLFGSRHTTQLRDASFDPSLVGKYARQSRKCKPKKKKTSVRRFRSIHRHIACILSCTRERKDLKNTVSRVIDDVLKIDDPTDLLSSSSTSSTKNKRYASIKNEGLIQGDLLDEIMAEYIEDRPNVGNENANFSPNKDQVKASNLALAKTVKSGDWYTCQSKVEDEVAQAYDQRKAGE